MISTRSLHPSDVDLVCAHRDAMFREAGKSAEALRIAGPAFRTWLTPRLADGSYFGFVAEYEQRPIAGIGVFLLDWPPHPLHPESHTRGYLLNLYVEPPHRRQGIARHLMRVAEDELKAREIGYVVLHASVLGRPLYEHMGWQGTNEMAKVLR